MPTNLYGPRDNYDLHSSMLPALIRKFHEGREAGQASVTIWGTGAPLREFALRRRPGARLRHADGAPGCHGHLQHRRRLDIAIAELATLVARVVGFRGAIDYDRSSPTAHAQADGLRTHPGIGLASGDLARARHRAGLRPFLREHPQQAVLRGLRVALRGRQTGLPMHAFLSRHVAAMPPSGGWWSTARDRPPRWSPCPCCSGSWARWASGNIP